MRKKTSLPYVYLKKRSDFLATQSGFRLSKAGFSLHGRKRLVSSETAEVCASSQQNPPRFGLTVTKKQGNAVKRNRMKRRLREVIRAEASQYAQSGFDYVLIARAEALSLPFASLRESFSQAMATLHQKLR